jgi:alpha-tubulin suppressor-like RCC1 family protein
VLEAAAGYDHTMAILDGQLYVWGNVQALGQNAAGQQKTPLAVSVTSPRHVAAGYETSFVATLNGSVYAFGSDQGNSLGLNVNGNFVSTPTQMVGLSNVTQLAAGNLAGLALTSGGDLYEWGSASGSQIAATPTLISTGIAQPQ